MNISRQWRWVEAASWIDKGKKGVRWKVALVKVLWKGEKKKKTKGKKHITVEFHCIIIWDYFFLPFHSFHQPINKKMILKLYDHCNSGSFQQTQKEGTAGHVRADLHFWLNFHYIQHRISETTFILLDGTERSPKVLLSRVAGSPIQFFTLVSKLLTSHVAK